MTQWLQVLAALAEDSSPVPSNHVAQLTNTFNSSYLVLTGYRQLATGT